MLPLSAFSMTVILKITGRSKSETDDVCSKKEVLQTIFHMPWLDPQCTWELICRVSSLICPEAPLSFSKVIVFSLVPRFPATKTCSCNREGKWQLQSWVCTSCLKPEAPPPPRTPPHSRRTIWTVLSVLKLSDLGIRHSFVVWLLLFCLGVCSFLLFCF